MLILSRRVGESIKIGNDITLVVLGVQGMQVRLGVEAPKSLPVDRKEIAERKATGSNKAPAEPEPLFGNRTEAEWRLLLVEEAEEQRAWDKGCGHDVA